MQNVMSKDFPFNVPREKPYTSVPLLHYKCLNSKCTRKVYQYIHLMHNPLWWSMTSVFNKWAFKYSEVPSCKLERQTSEHCTDSKSVDAHSMMGNEGTTKFESFMGLCLLLWRISQLFATKQLLPFYHHDDNAYE